MRINSIKIKNFRQYQNQFFDFTKKTEFDLGYILAENGIGKTTLLNAITWCLYGKELHVTTELKEKTLPLLTLKTLREMNISDNAETSVEICLKELDSEVTFSRSFIYRKTEENLPFEIEKKQKVIVFTEQSGPKISEKEDDFEKEVNKRLPAKIQQFFFFDGEQLDTYLAKTAEENVEHAVLEISQIDLLVSMSKYLTAVNTDIRGDISKTGPKLKEYNDKYNQSLEKLNTLKDKLQNACRERDNADSELLRINGLLGSDPDISGLEKERKESEDKINDLQKDIANNNLSIKDFLRKSLLNLSALPSLKSLYDLIKEKENNNQLPPKYDREELEKMLNESHCFVCGRELDLDAKSHIINLLKRFELGQRTGVILTSTSGFIQHIISETSKYEKERDNLYYVKEKLEKEKEKCVEKINKIDGIINKYPNKEEIIKLNNERNDFKKIYDENQKLIGTFETEIKIAENERDVLFEQYNKELEKDKKNKRLKLEKELTEKAYNKVEYIIGNIKSQIREKISTEMCEKFLNLMWKKKFKKVSLNEEYSASVINEDDLECLGSCSAAERELLVLAFTLALHQESGFEGPLVIDTPLSRVSGELRASFARVLKEVSKNKQIILFITGDEYTSQVQEIIEPASQCKYKLKLQDEDYVRMEK